MPKTKLARVTLTIVTTTDLAETVQRGLIDLAENWCHTGVNVNNINNVGYVYVEHISNTPVSLRNIGSHIRAMFAAG